MTQRDWEQRRRPHARRSSSTARSSRTATRAASAIEDDSFLLLFNAHYEDVDFTLPTPRFGGGWTLELSHRRTRTAEPGARSVAARGRARRRRSVVVLRAGPMTRAARHLPPAARPERLRPRRRARLVPYLRDLGISHLYLSPSLQARAARRTATTSSTPPASRDALGGEDALRALARRGARRDPRHRPQPHGRRATRTAGGRRSCGRSSSTSIRRAAGTAASSTSTTSPRSASSTRRSSTSRTARSSSSCATASSTACASTTPTAWPTPPATCSGCASAGPSTSGSRRSCEPGEPLRDWPVDGTVGYEFLNDADGALRRPGRRGGDDRPLADLTGDARRVRASSRSTPSSSRRRRRSRARSTGCARSHDVPAMADALAALPVYRTYVEPWSGPVDDEDRAAVAAAGMADRARARAAARGAAATRSSSPASSRRRRR